MYVYIAKFAKWPNLVKIGFSDNPEGRIRLLESVHGRGVIVDTFYAGYKPRYVEFCTHGKFSAFKRNVEGTGGKEFFCETVVDDVVAYIRTTHLPTDLQSSLIAEQAQYDRCTKFSRRMLGNLREKGHRSDSTFRSNMFRISLGVQILVEHGMGVDEAYKCYASILNRKLCKQLTGWRLRVAITCAGKGHWEDGPELSVKYRKAKEERIKVEAELKVQQRKY